MKARAKRNDAIQADPDAFIEAYLKAREVLGGIEGVVSVGFGRKEVAGALTPEVCISAFVLEKRPADELAAARRVPASFEGYLTDVRIVEEVVPAICDNQNRYPTIQGGIQIQARNVSSTVVGDNDKGTLACIVRKRGDDAGDNYYVLTADHVLSHDNADLKALVYQASAPPPGDNTSAQVIAFVEDYGRNGEVDYDATRPDGTRFPIRCFVDCGIARLDLASRCCGCRCGTDNVTYDTTIVDLDPGNPSNNRISDVRDIGLDPSIVLSIGDLSDLGGATDANRVVKVGRTTGRTVGVVTHINSAAWNGGVTVGGLIEIELDPSPLINPPSGLNCHGNALFIEGGDSGSLILDMQNRAVGLAFASQRREGRRRSFACHIIPVLDTLRVTIPVTSGTGRGSSGATDGSGIARYGGSVDHLTDDGTVLFSGQVASGPIATAADPVLHAAARSHDEQPRERLQQFLEALQETAVGRALYQDYLETRLEVSYLVRKQRQVMVTWHRNQGPAFLAALMMQLRGEVEAIPVEIAGISCSTLLARMEEMLHVHGSEALREAVERQREILMQCAEATTVTQCLDVLNHCDTRVSR